MAAMTRPTTSPMPKIWGTPCAMSVENETSTPSIGSDSKWSMTACFESSESSRRGSVNATFTRAVEPSSETTRMSFDSSMRVAPCRAWWSAPRAHRARRRAWPAARRVRPAGRRAVACWASRAAICSAGAPAASACCACRRRAAPGRRRAAPVRRRAASGRLDLRAAVVDLGAAVGELLLLVGALRLGREGVDHLRHVGQVSGIRHERGDLGLLLVGERRAVGGLEDDGARGAAEVGQLLLQFIGDGCRMPCRGCRSSTRGP